MPEPKRQLAAIMFTDIVGYTKLMGEDEGVAMKVLEASKKIHEEAIGKFNGKLLKHIGDGVLASFHTVSEAVYCAGEILTNASREGFEISIGIHEGEILVKDGDVFGDGVNIAARIEELASAGEIIVSESAFFNVKNKEGISGEFVEETQLKNVDRPVRVYKVEISPTANSDTPKKEKKSNTVVIGIIVVLALIGTWYFSDLFSSSTITRKSIAALPLKNLTGNENEEYLSDGMTEEIIYRLSQVAGFDKVISSTSTQEYKNTTKKIVEIAEELDVAYVLEGSFQKIGNQVKITVKLIDGQEDNEVWSESFERPYTDLFKIQSDIALRIAGALQARLTDEETGFVTKKPTENIEAWEFYRSGRNYLWRARQKWGEDPQFYEEFSIALQQFDKAISLDSSFTSAYLGRAAVHRVVQWYGLERTEERKKKTMDNLAIAKALDPDGAEYLFGEAMFEYQVQRDYDKALLLFSKLTNKYPNFSDGYLGQALIYRRTNKWEESLNLLKRVAELNPRDLDDLDVIGETARYSRNYEPAIDAFQLMLDLAPDDKLTKYHLSRVGLEWKGEVPDLETNPLDHYYFNRDWKELAEILPTISIPFDSEFGARPFELNLALISYISKDGDGDVEGLARVALENLNGSGAFSWRNAAMAYALLGQPDSALIYANKVIDRKSFERDSYTGYYIERDLAKIYLISGNYDLLFPRLEWMLTNSGSNPLTVEVLKLDPLFDPVRNDPRFIELIERTEFQVKPGLKVGIDK